MSKENPSFINAITLDFSNGYKRMDELKAIFSDLEPYMAEFILNSLSATGTKGSFFNLDMATPLMCAASSSQLEMVKYFLSLPEIDVTVVDCNGQNALHHATSPPYLLPGIRPDIILLLIERFEDSGEDVNVQDNEGRTPLDVANGKKLRSLLINKGLKANTTDGYLDYRERKSARERDIEDGTYTGDSESKIGNLKLKFYL